MSRGLILPEMSSKKEVGGASNIFCPGATKHLVTPLGTMQGSLRAMIQWVQNLPVLRRVDQQAPHDELRPLRWLGREVRILRKLNN